MEGKRTRRAIYKRGLKLRPVARENTERGSSNDDSGTESDSAASNTIYPKALIPNLAIFLDEVVIKS